MIKFDHIIHYVNDLDAVKSEGVLPIHSGGEHPAFGTENALSYFDLRYIEYLTISDEKQFNTHLEDGAESFARTIADKGYEEGFIRYAINTDKIEQLAERYRAKGFSVSGPVDMERETAGETIRWTLLYIKDDVETFPFFIEWEESDDMRLSRIEAMGKEIISPEIVIHNNVVDLKRWEAFYDVVGVWEGQLDSRTTVSLKETGVPSITLQVGMEGTSAHYRGADYRFI